MSNAIYPDLPGCTNERALSPQFSTKIQTSVNRKEYRTSLSPIAIYDIQLNYEFLRSAKQESQALIGFFCARRGSFDSFLFNNEDDNQVTNQFIATGDGQTKAFQLVRSFGPDIQPVMNVNVLANVKVNGVVMNPVGDYTVSSTGLVTFTNAPAAVPITWTGTYYYRCRFTTDTQEFDKFMDKLWSASQVDLTGCLGDRI